MGPACPGVPPRWTIGTGPRPAARLTAVRPRRRTGDRGETLDPSAEFSLRRLPQLFRRRRQHPGVNVRFPARRKAAFPQTFFRTSSGYCINYRPDHIPMVRAVVFPALLFRVLQEFGGM